MISAKMVSWCIYESPMAVLHVGLPFVQRIDICICVDMTCMLGKIVR